MKGRPSFGNMSGATWRPRDRDISRSRLAGAMRRWGFHSLADLHRASIDDPNWFWRAALDDLGVTFSPPWRTFVDNSSGRIFPRWFTGGKLNVAWHCVERHAADASARDRLAVVYEGDSGERRALSFQQLGSEVERVAAGLRGLGVEKGDRVGLFLPVIP